MDKVKTRPNWTPSSVNDVSEPAVRFTFFDKESPFHNLAPAISLPDPTTERRSFRHYGLPTETDIEAVVVRGERRMSNSHRDLTPAELLANFQVLTNGKHGLKEHLDEVLARKCEHFLGGDGVEYLKWKY